MAAPEEQLVPAPSPKPRPTTIRFWLHLSAHTIAPALYANLSYDPSRDFAAVIPLGINPFVLVVPPEKGFKTAREFVAAANAKPSMFNFASVGVGSASECRALFGSAPACSPCMFLSRVVLRR